MPSAPVTELGRFRAWHFTSVLKSVPDIDLHLAHFASEDYRLDKVLVSCALFRWHIENDFYCEAGRCHLHFMPFFYCEAGRCHLHFMPFSPHRCCGVDVQRGNSHPVARSRSRRLHSVKKCHGSGSSPQLVEDVGGKLCDGSDYQSFGRLMICMHTAK